MEKVSRALLVLTLSCILTACATAKGEIKTVLLYPPIPYELLSCTPEPVPQDVETQEDVAIWAEEVRQAGKDCRRNLDGLRAFILSWESMVDMMDIWTDLGDDYGT